MIKLSVVTPERAFLEKECENVTLPGKLGDMQVLEGHTPCLVELKTGIVSYESKKEKIKKFMIARGFAEVDHKSVNILCDSARNKAEVDEEYEISLQEKLQSKLEKTQVESGEDFKRVKAELDKSVASLKLFE